MMKVDIWSDVRCPFCYIGKHKFEKALSGFAAKDEIEVNWHSFELDPNLETNTAINAVDHLAEVKGTTREQIEQMQGYVLEAAKEVGLKFDFGRSVVANSFDAHRLIQFAKSWNKANEVEENLFHAHFVEGKNIDDSNVLKEAGIAAGLDKDETEKMLATNQYADDVRRDEMRAHSLGISGVPFFIFNNKYAVSGAQSPAVFAQALEKSWSEFNEVHKPVIINDGDTCSADGTCD